MRSPPPDKKVPIHRAGDHPSLDQSNAQRSAFYQALRAAKSRTLERAPREPIGHDGTFDLLQPIATELSSLLGAQFDTPEAASTLPASSDCSISAVAHTTQPTASYIPTSSESAVAEKNLLRTTDHHSAHQRPTAPNDIAEWLAQHLIQMIEQKSEHRSTIWTAIVPLNPAVLPRTCAEIAADHETVAIGLHTAMPSVHHLLSERAEYFRHRISRVIVRTVLINIVYDPTVAEPQQSSNR